MFMNNYLIKQTVPPMPYQVCRRVKGKQVKVLHDLVTVIAEQYTIMSLSHREGCISL